MKRSKKQIEKDPSILIVDDDPISMEALTNHLTTVNFPIKQCTSGYEAIEYLKTDKPILVMLDVLMPGINGYDVCKKIREKYSLLDLPIIFTTAMTRPEDLAQGFSLGCNDYLMKPFSKHELLARVKNQITISISQKRLENLNNFSSEIWDLRKADHIAMKLFNYIIEDSKINCAALFINKALIKNTFPHKKQAMQIFDQWEKDNSFFGLGGVLVLAEPVGTNDYVAVLKSSVGIDEIDKKYFKNLIDQTRSIYENFQMLIKDKYFLEDLNIILNYKKHIRFIKAENKQTVLYEDKTDQTLYLKSSLKTIEYVFGHVLIRINRFVLVNPEKVISIEQKYDDKMKAKKYILNADGEEFAISGKLFCSLPDKLKRATGIQ